MKFIMYSVLAEEKSNIAAWEKKTGNQVTQIEDRITPAPYELAKAFNWDA